MRRRPMFLLIALLLIIFGLVALVTRPMNVDCSIRVMRTNPSARPIVERVQTDAGTVTGWIVRFGTRLGLWISGRSVRPGWYHIASSTSALDVVRMIVAGTTEPLIKVTIPEGFTISEIAGRLRARAEIDSTSFIKWCMTDSVLRAYDIPASSMEGFLMPDTYFVIRQDEPEYVATMMARQAQRLWKEIAKGLPEGGAAARLRLTTLASIVQLEAGRNDEMHRIAGVYQNRLRIGMRLQADPTVQYLTGKNRITRSELQNSSNPYNTYVHSGLPPGPICNPGKNALVAAMQPETHDWIFFVARGDGSMRHRFARTLEEHNENVRLYRNNIKVSRTN